MVSQCEFDSCSQANVLILTFLRALVNATAVAA